MTPHNSPPAVDSSAEHFPELRDFSLVIGGPLYQLLRRARLEDDAVVHAHGCELMTRGVPVQPDVIEALMRDCELDRK